VGVSKMNKNGGGQQNASGDDPSEDNKNNTALAEFGHHHHRSTTVGSLRLATPDDDDEPPITINIMKPSPTSISGPIGIGNAGVEESQPLLMRRKIQDSGERDDSSV